MGGGGDRCVKKGWGRIKVLERTREVGSLQL